MLMHYIPEVKGIQEVTASVEPTGDVESDKELKLSYTPQPAAASS